MMRRPVVKEDILTLIRDRQKKLTGKLGDIEREAREKGVPIIPHETVVFMQFLLGQLQPKHILEIGTAIGFSASLMAQTAGPDSHVTTIERFDVMSEQAKKNVAELSLENQITILEGQAADILPTLQGEYDFVFMDSAKAKYIDFLPDCLRLLKKKGVVMIDDVFQGGTVMHPVTEIHRSQRGIHRKLNELFDKVLTHEDLTTSLVPLGDGVLLITKEKDNVSL